MIINICLIVMILCVLIFDLKVQRIPNYITFSGIIIGLTLYTVTSGISGLFDGILGMLAGIALLLIPFSMRGIGGGDVKLLGAIGAFKGVQFVFNTFLASAVFGGIIAVVIIIYKGKIIETLKWCFKSLYKIILLLFTNGRRNIQSGGFPAKGIAYPYGLAISLGTLLILVLEVIK